MDVSAFFPHWALTHGASALVVIPLLVAVCIALMPGNSSGERAAWGLTLLTCLAGAWLAAGMLAQVLCEGPIAYDMGGWAPPAGISYYIDGLNAPILLLITMVAFLCVIYALPGVILEIEPGKRGLFYAAFLVCLSGLLGVVATGDAFNVFVFLEVASISTYALVAMGASRDRRALSSAYNYLIMGSIGATFFVIGVGFLYMATGTLNMIDMAGALQDIGPGNRVVRLAFAFVIIGLGLKLAMFPLHTWLPGAYAYAPGFFSAFLAATATKAALYLMLRFTFTVFDPAWDFIAKALTLLIVALAVTGILVASLQAIFQNDIRRVFAFSSVAQVGYMLLGIGMMTSSGLFAGYLHIINHAVIKGALFLAVAAFWYRFGATQIDDIEGIGRTMPLSMAAFTIAGLSLIGVPGTAGFVSKLALMRAAAENGWWWAIAVIVAASILAIIYTGRVIEKAYFHEPPKHGRSVVAKHEAPLIMLVPLWILALSAVYFGINTEWTTALAESAVKVLNAGPVTDIPYGGGH